MIQHPPRPRPPRPHPRRHRPPHPRPDRAPIPIPTHPPLHLHLHPLDRPHPHLLNLRPLRHLTDPREIAGLKKDHDETKAELTAVAVAVAAVVVVTASVTLLLNHPRVVPLTLWLLMPVCRISNRNVVAIASIEGKYRRIVVAAVEVVVEPRTQAQLQSNHCLDPGRGHDHGHDHDPNRADVTIICLFYS